MTPAELDNLAASLAPAGAAAADDGAFLRRLSLDLMGRPPTLREARAFIDDRAPDKRARLVDQMLGSNAFVQTWAERWELLLLGRQVPAPLRRAADPRGYLEAALAENRPLDRMTRELLTARGALSDNGALAFLVTKARAGGPEAAAGGVGRIFLGLQLQCAQCHDHPTDPRWKQDDFYGLVAFFARTRARRDKEPEPEPPVNAPGMSDNERMMAAGMAAEKAARGFVVVDTPRGQARMRRPGSDQDEIVLPKFLGRPAAERPGETRRQTLARHVIASDLFGKAAVNRTWAWLFGRGIVDPWDDLGAEDDERHPVLLRRLAEDFVASGHDQRHLIRQLVLSRAYAAQSGVRPLSPEQLVRTLVTITGVDEVGRRRLGEEAVERKLEQAMRQFTFLFGDDEGAEVDAFDGNVPQALVLLNGELTNLGTRAAPAGTLGRVLAASQDARHRLADLFLATYTRAPRPDEQQSLLTEINRRGGTREAWEDVFFALAVSTEAVTNH